MKLINNKGFTIIELLIATVVFSVVLLIITGAIVQFNRLYYKGTINTKTQETTRAIVEDIARNIQFAAGPSGVRSPTPVPASPGEEYICAGDYVYRYKKDSLLSSTQPVLRRYQLVCGVSFPASGGTELMGDDMFLDDIQLTGTNPYTLTVKIGYGQDYLTNHSCTGVRLGGAFCGFNTLNVTVSRRLN